MRKPRLPRTPEELNEWAARFFETIKGESDRGCVLIAAAFLDEALELLLRSRMATTAPVVKASIDPLFTGIGPLKSFWAKTELCRSLKLLAHWEHADLSRIRNLRNLFAHSYEKADFDDPRVVAIVSKLFGGLPKTKYRPKANASPMKEARQRFSLAAAWLAGTLHNRAGMAKHDD